MLSFGDSACFSFRHALVHALVQLLFEAASLSLDFSLYIDI
jgi:hypothetical protein